MDFAVVVSSRELHILIPVLFKVVNENSKPKYKSPIVSSSLLIYVLVVCFLMIFFTIR